MGAWIDEEPAPALPSKKIKMKGKKLGPDDVKQEVV
jgi:hypothetical protein